MRGFVTAVVKSIVIESRWNPVEFLTESTPSDGPAWHQFTSSPEADAAKRVSGSSSRN